MSDSKKKKIQDKAVELIRAHPDGIRWSELIRKLQEAFPETPKNTLQGSTWNLYIIRNSEIYKPTRGLFKFRTPTESQLASTPVEPVTRLREDEFYEPFANYLKNELGECTEAIGLGGSVFGTRWGTPDVVGVYKPMTRDLIKFNAEIICAEVKTNPSDPITAFGQAVAYRLFCSKSFLVEPDSISQEDLDRIESLCMLYGIGLILFKLNLDNPDFSIRVRAQKFNPDMFYVNKFAEELKAKRPDAFDTLFG